MVTPIPPLSERTCLVLGAHFKDAVSEIAKKFFPPLQGLKETLDTLEPKAWLVAGLGLAKLSGYDKMELVKQAFYHVFSAAVFEDKTITVKEVQAGWTHFGSPLFLMGGLLIAIRDGKKQALERFLSIEKGIPFDDFTSLFRPVAEAVIEEERWESMAPLLIRRFPSFRVEAFCVAAAKGLETICTDLLKAGLPQDARCLLANHAFIDLFLRYPGALPESADLEFWFRTGTPRAPFRKVLERYYPELL